MAGALLGEGGGGEANGAVTLAGKINILNKNKWNFEA
jgi:hypothetical protein